MPSHIELLARLDSDIRAASIPIDGVSGVVSPYDPSTVTVTPSNLQPDAQPIIDAFDGSQEAQDAWEADRKQQKDNLIAQELDFSSLPRSDPHEAGKLWIAQNNFVKMSDG